MQDMMGNGSKEQMLDRDKEDRFGLMVQCTRAGGIITQLMEEAD